jgi:hypothetical protein
MRQSAGRTGTCSRARGSRTRARGFTTPRSCLFGEPRDLSQIRKTMSCARASLEARGGGRHLSNARSKLDGAVESIGSASQRAGRMATRAAGAMLGPAASAACGIAAKVTIWQQSTWRSPTVSNRLLSCPSVEASAQGSDGKRPNASQKKYRPPECTIPKKTAIARTQWAAAATARGTRRRFVDRFLGARRTLFSAITGNPSSQGNGPTTPGQTRPAAAPQRPARGDLRASRQLPRAGTRTPNRSDKHGRRARRADERQRRRLSARGPCDPQAREQAPRRAHGRAPRPW